MGMPFLTAEWRDLLVFNFEVDPAILQPYVPIGTELDFHNGKTFISLVAFRFCRNRLFGFLPTIPAVNFDEVNLRFYIRRTIDGEQRRAVAFIREIVPSHLIANAARVFYNEPYVRHPMRHKIESDIRQYAWNDGKYEHSVSGELVGKWKDLQPGTHEHFILEHYWGYTQQVNGSTCEYQVKHPPWRIRDVQNAQLSSEIASYYGAPFDAILRQKPFSILAADGSAVSVSTPNFFRGRLPVQSLPQNEIKGWVLYDGACGFCSWWIPFWRKTILQTGFDIAALQESWVREALNLPLDQLNADIRLLMRDGTLINGADAYLYGMRKVWWSAPVGFLLSLPGLRQLTWAFYKLFNRNRFFVSRVCRLPAKFK